MRWQRLVSLLALTAALAGCRTVTTWTPGAESEFSTRRAADVQLSEPVTLFDFSPGDMVGLISRDGHAHVVAIDDESNALHHAEVDDTSVVSSERISDAPKGTWRHLDLVEFPPQTLRVLAGASQFVRDPTSLQWQELKGNQCLRFVKSADRLYCGFVVSGEEFGTPTRVDVYGGAIYVFPFLFPVPQQSKKLVLAELIDATWTARFVVDAEDVLDANPLFLIDADREGSIHLLYEAERGGGFFYDLDEIFGYGHSIRYALIDRVTLEQAAKEPHDAASKSFAVVKGVDVGNLSDLQFSDNGFSWEIKPRYMRRDQAIALNPVSRTIEGVVSGFSWFHSQSKPRIDGLFEIQLSGDAWKRQLRLVIANSLGYSLGYRSKEWVYGERYDGPLVKMDTEGVLHVIHIVTGDPDGVVGRRSIKKAVSYLVKQGGSWSLPTTFLLSHDVEAHAASPRALLAVGIGRAFVGWAEKRGGLHGRWIHSRESSKQ